MDTPVDSDALREMSCPACGETMSHGYIAGHWFRLRWTEHEKTKTVFSGSPLRRKVDLWNSPVLEAVRCEHCRVGVFRYDY